MYRQGDVLLIPVAEHEVPAQVRPLPRDAAGRLVLAFGETTGHAHAIRAANAVLLADRAEVDRRFVRLASDAILTQEEHDPIALRPEPIRWSGSGSTAPAASATSLTDRGRGSEL
jgi:hypothetical protein